MSNEQEKWLQAIRELSFACLETALYLDAYPENRQALCYFTECKRRLAELTENYEEAYGPLTHAGAGEKGTWNWVDGPWPWQKEDSHVDL